MRLINTETLKLEEFLSEDGLVYVALSHHWEEDEVSLKDMETLAKEQLESKKGYRKIARFCNKLKSRGYNYGWMDTCCIDKSSSAELSEAIDSMSDSTKTQQSASCTMSDVISEVDN